MESQEIKHLQMYFYLVPVLGFFPALWTLYRRQGSEEEQSISRLAVTLALMWLAGSILCSSGAQISESLGLRLLIVNTLLASGYCLTNLWLMWRLLRRQKVRLPGVSNLAEKVGRKYLS